MTSIQELCILRYLKEAVKECEAYDGWTANEQLEHYIRNNGFNPILELKETKKRLINKYCSKEIKEEIEYYHTTNDLDLERLKTLGGLIDERDVGMTVRTIIYELYGLRN